MSPQSVIEYSVVIPVFNSTESVVELCKKIKLVFTEELKVAYEILLIDDGSSNPKTWISLQDIAKSDLSVTSIRLMRNFGKHNAVFCGLEHCRGQYVFLMDDDLQHDPMDFCNFVSNREHDVVMGAYVRKRHSFGKRLASIAKGFFDWKILGIPKGIQITSFLLVKKKVVDQILSMSTAYPIMVGLIFSVTSDIVNVPVRHHNRKYGRSQFTLVKMIKLFSNLLINHSSLLLRSVSVLGLIMAVTSILLACYFVIKKLTDGIAVMGWTSLIVINLLIGGMILFSIGVIGEYLVRIISSTEKRPIYVVREIRNYEQS